MPPLGTSRWLPRLAAALIACAAWLGLTLQFLATYGHVGSVLAALWVLADFFTILTNLVIAALFTDIAFSGREAPRTVGGLTLAILLVGIVYALLLRSIDHPEGLAKAANDILHIVTPVLVPLFWLAVVRKGALRLLDPFVFAAFPLLYFVYAMARGAATGHYPYPFLNVAKIGWPQTFINAGLIALGFLIGGYVLLALDRGLRALAARI
ncbi:MAG: Pr6Pr family membrane protein [Pseudomonadota bacterium]